MYTTVVRTALAALVMGVMSGYAYGADPAHPQHFRVSTLKSMAVRNAAGEDLGKINDIVIDMNTAKVNYVALEFGGFLGVGDKLFAIPWHAFKYQPKPDDEHLVLNVTKERLKNAPGFDKNHWPNMANPRWNAETDAFYESTSVK